MRFVPVLIAFLLIGCASIPNPFQGFQGGTRKDIREAGEWYQKETRTPVVLPNNSVLSEKIEREYGASYSKTTPKKTLGEKIGGFFAGLSITGLIFVAISLLAFGGAPILWLWAKFLKARAALKRTIAGIEALNAEEKEKVKAVLEKTQDVADKKYIANLKAEIKRTELK